eukprot:3415204-Prymnesium_polylepis.1
MFALLCRMRVRVPPPHLPSLAVLSTSVLSSISIGCRRLTVASSPAVRTCSSTSARCLDHEALARRSAAILARLALPPATSRRRRRCVAPASRLHLMRIRDAILTKPTARPVATQMREEFASAFSSAWLCRSSSSRLTTSSCPFDAAHDKRRLAHECRHACVGASLEQHPGDGHVACFRGSHQRSAPHLVLQVE